MDGGGWQATVHWVAKSRTQLKDFTSLAYLEMHYLMSTYLRILKDTFLFLFFNFTFL